MKNIEKYYDEIFKKINDEGRHYDPNLACCVDDLKIAKGWTCDDSTCKECSIRTLKWLISEYKEPCNKLTKNEHKFLSDMPSNQQLYRLDYLWFYDALKSMGWFKGVLNPHDYIKKIMENCEVEEC